MAPPGSRDLVVRPEQPGDELGIRDVELAAFGGPDEAAIVDAARAAQDWDPGRSLVAVDPRGRIVGHLLLSVCRVVAADGAEAGTVHAIGPVAVLPSEQGTGVGSALMRAAIAEASARGAPAIVLLGHPEWYPRFGFVQARPLGLLPQQDWPDAAWMALPLREPLGVAGMVRYPAAFGLD